MIIPLAVFFARAEELILMGSFIIIGAGISGCTAALELARLGHAVTLIEAEARAGGKVLSYCCKATDECSRCGVCIAHTAIEESLRHERITLITGAVLEGFDPRGDAVSVRIRYSNPHISHNKCTACDKCMQQCPQKCISKYNRGGVVQYSIDYQACLLHAGKACRECVAACAASAVTANGKTTTVELVADAVCVATGHDVFNASLKPRFGYGRLDNVLTGYEAEQILSRQTYLVRPAESVAFIQCVGSRDPKIGRNWCSSVCCAYAFRMARMLMHRNKEADVTVYYIDIQNFDKAFTAYRNTLIESGMKFIRAIPFSIEKSQSGRLIMKIEDASGNRSFAEHDVAVLSVGMGPAENADSVAKLFGLAQDSFGFFRPEARNIFVTGTCREPQTITDAIGSAKATALEMVRSKT